MIVGINVFDLIIILGSIQGFIFAIYLLFRPLQNKRASIFLSLFILAFAANSVYHSLEAVGLRGRLNAWDFSLFYCSILIIVSFYFFIHCLIYPNKKISVWQWLLFVPYALQVMVQLFGTYLSFVDTDFLMRHEYTFYKVYNIFDLISLVLGVILLVVSMLKIKRYEINLQKNYAEIEDFSLRWLNHLLIFLFGVWVLFALPSIYELATGYSPMSMYYPLWIASSALIYWIGYSTYFKRRTIEPILYDLEVKEDQSKLSVNTKGYHEKLLALMDKEKPYLDQDLNLKTLADKLDLSSGYLSQIINQYESRNFFEFVNGYRVSSVQEKIGNPDYQHLNMLGMAYDSGFKSKSTFNLVFKKITGLTPTAYKKSKSKA